MQKENATPKNSVSGKEKLREFEALAEPLIKFINDKYNPHTKIIITSDSAEVVSGQMATFTDKYIKD